MNLKRKSRELFEAAVKGNLIDFAAREVAVRFGSHARRRPADFYAGLAVVFCLVIVTVFLIGRLSESGSHQSVDVSIRARFSSPRPDPAIVILEIDERSLAALSSEFGRWPWPRAVLAETMSTLADVGAASVVLNVMLSDPDKGNPDSDATFDDVAAHGANFVFPIVRLNPKNDSLSQVTPAMLSGVIVSNQVAAQRPIALLFPFFKGTHDKLGFNQLHVDSDGAVRVYDPYLIEPGFQFPSMAVRALQAAGVAVAIPAGGFPKGMQLNWRNKRGDYRRVSFSDVYSDIQKGNEKGLAQFRGAIVIIGPTAPGISTLKGTAAASLMDDNVVIATAIDDLKNKTYLRAVPAWLTALIACLVIGLFARAFIVRFDSSKVNRYFALVQMAVASIIVVAISYTPYVIDLSGAFFYGAAYFTIAKLYNALELNAVRGNPTYSDFKFDSDVQAFTIIGVNRDSGSSQAIGALRSELERSFGIRRVFYVDNLFDSGHMLQGVVKGVHFLFITHPLPVSVDPGGLFVPQARGEPILLQDLVAKAKVTVIIETAAVSLKADESVGSAQERALMGAALQTASRLV